MGASTRSKHEKKQNGRGNLENQSRAKTPVIRATFRSNVYTSKQRGVLIDVTNSLQSPSRDPSAKGEAHEAEIMKEKPIVTPVRVSARISAAKAQKYEKEPTDSNIHKRIFNSVRVTTKNVEGKVVEEATCIADETRQKNQAKNPILIGETNYHSFSQTDRNVKLVHQPRSKRNNMRMHEKNLVDGNRPICEINPLEAKFEDGVDQPVHVKLVPQTREKISDQPLEESNAQSIRGRGCQSRIASTRKVGHEPSKVPAKILCKLKEVPISRKSSRKKRGALVQSSQIPSPGLGLEEITTSSSAQKRPHGHKEGLDENVPSIDATNSILDSPVASNSKESVARRPARQSKLTFQNQQLTLETTTSSDAKKKVSESESNMNQNKTTKSIAASKQTPRAQVKGNFRGSAAKMKTSLLSLLATSRGIAQTKVDSHLTSPKLRSSMRSSSKLSPARKVHSSPHKTVNNKKVPIYKSETKPETLQPAEADVYDFGYDPKDVRPRRKRQRRPKNASPVKRAKKPRVEPENLPPIELMLPEELVEKLKVMQTNKKTVESPTITVQSPQTPIAIDLMDQSIPCPSVSQLPASIPINCSTPYVSSHRSLSCDRITPIVEKTLEMGSIEPTTEQCLVGVLGQVSANENNKPAPPPLTIENCFGFDGPEEESQSIQSVLMKSTPIKIPNSSGAAPFRPFVSPLRKALNHQSTGSRPARLEHSRGAIVLNPVTVVQEKNKQPTLTEVIQDLGTMDRSIEANKKGFCPPTPPTVFNAPPRRSYSKQEMRQVKRTMFKEHIEPEKSDHESVEEQNENIDSNKLKKKIARRRQKKNKQEKEVNDWAKMMAAHFDDIDKSALILSD